MPRTAIIKFVGENQAACVIHKIRIPEYKEPGFYVESLKAEFYCRGKRRNATKKEIETYRSGCTWAPWGMYYTHDWYEEEWLKKNERNLASFAKIGMDQGFIDEFDETKLPVIEHACLDDFFEFVGFDRKRRKYSRKESPYK